MYRLPDAERLAGEIDRKADRRMRAWIALNEDELMERWRFAAEGIPISSVD